MKHIEKIVINNARRLGENIEIDFGAGATIILAPNGTGKTTIFEAIELALTGKIKRIEDSPDVIIKDGISEMSVRLDFTGGKYCQANYARGGTCNQRGDYKDLFNIEYKASLPYLFRLTHFLEQRGKEWFVDQDGKDAGKLLSQLPLGKDLQQIIFKRNSLLRAIGTTETNAEIAFGEAEKRLSEFKALKAKRDDLAIQTSLTPLEEIITKLQPISKLIDSEEFKGIHNATQINTYFGKIKVLIKQENDIKKDLAIKFNTMKERVDLYISNLELLIQKQTVLSEHSNKMVELSSFVEQTKKGIQAEKESLSSIKDEIKKLNLVKSRFEEVERKNIYLVIKEAEVVKNEEALDELKKSYEVTIEYLRKIERLRDQHKLLNEAIRNQRNHLFQTEIKKEYQEKWQVLSKINSEIIEIRIPEIEKKKNEYLESMLQLNNEVDEAEKVYYTKKNALESLNKASSAIQDAVSSIRKHLSENQRNCPVCQAEYEPYDLINKIEASLNILNPAIPQAIIDEKKASESLEIAKEKQSEANQKLLDIISDLNMENNKLEANKKEISESFLPQFPGCKTSEEANRYIEEQITQITSQINELETKKSQLEPDVAIEETNNVNLKKCEDERSIHELVEKNNSMKNLIIVMIANINSINESLSGKEKEAILQDISSESIKEEEKMESIQKLEAILSKNEAELKEYQNSFFTEREAISKIKAMQEGIYTEWSQAGLEAQPNQEKLRMRHEAVSKSIDELEKAITELNIIEQELASWRTAEKFNDVDNEIKKQIGDASEEQYFESLKASVAQNKSILQNIIEKKNAVSLFLTNVALESEKINKQLNAINEPWKRLLKRIVINPLISTAPLLSNTTLRNQPIAKTSAIIHEQDIDITKIASEAQLTDLQLTLMLSMANKYQWTPWKALLLDDPTQHHDLVHASSVFDVLRDYIIELDYQVMMSTHDSVQAEFFQRKLDNEGVPSKIYQLVARKGGVTAERIS